MLVFTGANAFLHLLFVSPIKWISRHFCRKDRGLNKLVDSTTLGRKISKGEIEMLITAWEDPDN